MVDPVSMPDIPSDVQGADHDGHLCPFLDEATRPDAVVEGAFVVTGDEEAPVVARVLRLEDRPGGTMVVMEFVAAVSKLERALDRSHPHTT
ncbi:MAG: hypothetical protein LC792_28615 [Actinobacteria bacterium]|nr:hypothetical protein [Actinomycetota bacterium]